MYRAALCGDGCRTAWHSRRRASCRRGRRGVCPHGGPTGDRKGGGRVSRRTVPVVHPFPDVARHVEQAVSIRRERAATGGSLAGPEQRIGEEVRHGAIEVFTPWISFSFETAARRLFPFCFCWQPQEAPAHGRKPGAIRDRILPADERDGMIQSIRRRLRVQPDIRLAGRAKGAFARRLRPRLRQAGARKWPGRDSRCPVRTAGTLRGSPVGRRSGRRRGGPRCAGRSSSSASSHPITNSPDGMRANSGRRSTDMEGAQVSTG